MTWQSRAMVGVASTRLRRRKRDEVCAVLMSSQQASCTKRALHVVYPRVFRSGLGPCFLLNIFVSALTLLVATSAAETWSETEPMFLRGHHNTPKTRTQVVLPSAVDAAPNRELIAEYNAEAGVRARSSAVSGCKLEIKDTLSYDEISKNIKIATTFKNLCQADAKIMKLDMSTCVQCIDDDLADAVCSSPISVLDQFIAFNNGTDVIVKDIGKSINLAAELDRFGGSPGVACNSNYMFYAVFDYEAEALVPKSEVEELQKEINKKLDKQQSSEDAVRPNLKRELMKRIDDIGFAPTRALVTKVRELTCSPDSRACKEGACCGTEGCTCSVSYFTEENCLVGTTIPETEVIVPCFLSYDGNFASENQCCVFAAGCSSYC